MEIKDKKLKTHLFICTSCTYKQTDNSDSDPNEALNLRKNLKDKVNQKYGKGVVQVSASKCLSECKNGIAAVFYPQNEWLVNIRPNDEDVLFEKIEKLIND